MVYIATLTWPKLPSRVVSIIPQVAQSLVLICQRCWWREDIFQPRRAVVQETAASF